MRKKQAVYIIYAIICLCVLGVALIVIRNRYNYAHVKTESRSLKETSRVESISDEPVDVITITEGEDSKVDEDVEENQVKEKAVSENEIEDLTGFGYSTSTDNSEKDLESETKSEINDSGNIDEKIHKDSGIELPIIEF